MKKLLTIALMLVLATSLFAGCTPEAVDPPADDTTTIEKLVVYFVPSREPEEIVTATEPLKELLINELATMGYEIGEVDIQVGTSYEAVGEALSAGTAHVGLIPGGTYVLYDDGCDVILTATRAGLNKDSDVAADWNDGLPTTGDGPQVTYYKGLIVAGPSEKGQAIAAKVNNGEALTKEDMMGLNWGVRSATSSSGYIYPSLWLEDQFGITLSDITTKVQTDSYGSSVAQLASGMIDVATFYADARRDYADKWNTDFGADGSIWEQTNVVGVTEGIYNDTISVTNNNADMTPEFKAALQDAFINIAKTEEGLAVIDIYAHEGYQKAVSEDYDGARAAQEFLKSIQ